jgi:hypothetical protein
MRRRSLPVFLLSPWAVQAANLSEPEAARGVRAALERGAMAAVAALGRSDGFFAHPTLKIELPSHLKSAARVLKAAGQGARVDALVLAMNRAAEQAVPAARGLLVSTVQSISVEDALRLVRDRGDDAVTRFFETKTRAPLSAQFLPIVTRATEREKLADKANAVAGKAAGLGLVKPEDASIEAYVTRKALDGLYWMIGDEEKAIRRDPVGTGSALLKQVFGR